MLLKLISFILTDNASPESLKINKYYIIKYMHFTFARLNVQLVLLGSIRRVIGKFKIRIRPSQIILEIILKY